MPLAALRPFDADGAAPLDQDARRLGARRDGEVRARAHRRQEGRRRVAAPMAAQRQLIGAEAVGAFGVEVGIAPVAGLDAGLDPGGAIRMVVAQVRDARPG